MGFQPLTQQPTYRDSPPCAGFFVPVKRQTRRRGTTGERDCDETAERDCQRYGQGV